MNPGLGLVNPVAVFMLHSPYRFTDGTLYAWLLENLEDEKPFLQDALDFARDLVENLPVEEEEEEPIEDEDEDEDEKEPENG